VIFQDTMRWFWQCLCCQAVHAQSTTAAINISSAKSDFASHMMDEEFLRVRCFAYHIHSLIQVLHGAGSRALVARDKMIRFFDAGLKDGGSHYSKLYTVGSLQWHKHGCDGAFYACLQLTHWEEVFFEDISKPTCLVIKGKITIAMVRVR